MLVFLWPNSLRPLFVARNFLLSLLLLFLLLLSISTRRFVRSMWHACFQGKVCVPHSNHVNAAEALA